MIRTFGAHTKNRLLIRRARKVYVDDDIGLDLANTVYALDSTKTDKNPWGTGDAKCSCGQPHGKCSCDNRIARSAVMDIKPSANVLPFAAINKNLVAFEGAAMATMKKQIERGMIGRGF
jgi:hypothetical protein